LLAFCFGGVPNDTVPVRRQLAVNWGQAGAAMAQLFPGNVHDLGDWHGGDVAQLAVGVFGGLDQ